jgi:hypothetical protein
LSLLHASHVTLGDGIPTSYSELVADLKKVSLKEAIVRAEVMEARLSSSGNPAGLRDPCHNC